MNFKSEFGVTFNLKKEFDLVFQPATPPGAKRKRFLVSVNRLPDYVGEDWTKYLVKKMLEMTDDKKRFKIRHVGLLDAYRK